MSRNKFNLITNNSAGGLSVLGFHASKTAANRSCIVFIVIVIAIVILLQFGNNHKDVALMTKGNTNVIFSTSQYIPNCSELKKVQRTIASAKNKIWDDWKVSEYPGFLTMMHVPEESWEIQKAKFIKLIMSKNAADIKSVGASKKSLSYVVGFSGSSVTAAHDNYFHEGYPSVFNRSLIPTFEALGIELDVRNHALGNNPCFPYDACMSTHLGDDLDILSWEQVRDSKYAVYDSMNCGNGMMHTDTFSRIAFNMPKKPTLIFLESTGPHWTPADCVKLNITSTSRYTPSPHALQNTPPLSAVAASKWSGVGLKNIVRDSQVTKNLGFLRDDATKTRLFDKYHMMAPMGQSIEPAGWYQCHGPYNEKFSAKTDGGGASWHPGMMTHKLRGDVLAFTILSILQDAVDSIESSICKTPVSAAPTTATGKRHLSEETNVEADSTNGPHWSRLLNVLTPTKESHVVNIKSLIVHNTNTHKQTIVPATTTESGSVVSGSDRNGVVLPNTKSTLSVVNLLSLVTPSTTTATATPPATSTSTSTKSADAEEAKLVREANKKTAKPAQNSVLVPGMLHLPNGTLIPMPRAHHNETAGSEPFLTLINGDRVPNFRGARVVQHNGIDNVSEETLQGKLRKTAFQWIDAAKRRFLLASINTDTENNRETNSNNNRRKLHPKDSALDILDREYKSLIIGPPGKKTTAKPTTVKGGTISSGTDANTDAVFQSVLSAFNETLTAENRAVLNTIVHDLGTKNVDLLDKINAPFLISSLLSHYAKAYLNKKQDIVKLPPVPLHYNINETNSGQPSCYTDYQPRVQNSLTSQLLPHYTNWQLNLSFFDVRGVAKSIEKGYGYLDRKMIFSSVGKGSQIAVRINVKTPSPVWICECQKGFLRYPDYMGDIIDEGDVYVSLNYNFGSLAPAAASGGSVLSAGATKSGAQQNGKHQVMAGKAVNGGGGKATHVSGGVAGSGGGLRNGTRNAGGHKRPNLRRLEQEQSEHLSPFHHDELSLSDRRKLAVGKSALEWLESAPTTPTTSAATVVESASVADMSTSTTTGSTIEHEQQQQEKGKVSRKDNPDLMKSVLTEPRKNALDLIEGASATEKAKAATVDSVATSTDKTTTTTASPQQDSTNSNDKLSRKDKSEKPELMKSILDEPRKSALDLIEGKTPKAKTVKTPVLPPPPVPVKAESSLSVTGGVVAPYQSLDFSKFTKLEIEGSLFPCYRTTTNLPPGQHLLVLTQRGDNKKVNLAYVVTW